MKKEINQEKKTTLVRVSIELKKYIESKANYSDSFDSATRRLLNYDGENNGQL